MIRLAWTYVHARIINYIAVLVVGLTLMASIVVIGVTDGMLVDMERRTRNLGEQVALSFSTPISESSLKDIPDMEGVKGFTPLIRDYALLKHGLITEPGVAYGIDLKSELKMSSIAKHLQDIKLDPDNPEWVAEGTETGGNTAAFVGINLAERLGLSAGDTMTVSYSPPNSDKLISKDFYVSSIFSSGSPLKDRNGFFISLEDARKLFLTEAEQASKGVSGLSFFLDNPERANELEIPIIKSVIPALKMSYRGVYSTTWQKRWKSIHDGMAYENMLMEVVLFFMNISSGFCVFAVLATLASRRVKDVGLLRCLGAKRINTIGIFLFVGLFIGLMGVILGVGAGYLVGLNLSDIWEFLTGQPFYSPQLFGHTSPPVIYAWKVSIYAGAALFISLLSALYPALSAGCREPVTALKDE